MVIRNRFIIRIAGWLMAQFVRLWLCTLRMHAEWPQPDLDPRRRGTGRIYCLWHEDMLYQAYAFSSLGISVLISRSRDGELISQTVETLGFKTVRGSTNRGGMRAIREIIRGLDGSDIAITPDGPRGPRREFQAGAAYLASRAGMPLIAFGMAYERPWRLPSWDRLVLPRPFSRVVICATGPVTVPADANSAGLEEHRQKMESLMSVATQRAETLLRRWRTGEKLPIVSPEAKALQAAPLRHMA